MKHPFRALRITLAIAFVITLYFAYVSLFTPSILLEIYEVAEFDAMHRYFSMVSAALLVVLAIGMGLAFLQPLKYSSTVTLLILYHFVRFIVDIVLIVQGDIAASLLIPEMVYFLVVCGALVRFYPVKPKEEPVAAEGEKEEAARDEEMSQDIASDSSVKTQEENTLL